MKLKWFACLICLLLFVAAIDNVPDPPAIRPRGSDSSGIFPLHVRGASVLPQKERIIRSASVQTSQVGWFAFRLGFISELVDVRPVASVRHAADPSPPLFS